MKILFCASELSPLIKIGGLGDVAGSLPKALTILGIDISIAIPHYSTVATSEPIQQLTTISLQYNKQPAEVIISKTTLPNSTVPVFLFGNDRYIAEGGKEAFVGTVSEGQRFAFFSKALTEVINAGIIRELDDITLVHLNDWHTSLVPLLWKIKQQTRSLEDRPAFLLTIHNMAYQGVVPIDLLDELGITIDDAEELRWDAANNDIDILLQGLLHSDAVSTVSPTYAQEILTDQYSEGLGEILNRRKDALFGILNGIDYTVWNPADDKHIACKYISENLTQGKKANKNALQANVGLPEKDLPVIGFIGRIEPRQKGIDLIYEWLQTTVADQEATIANKFQFVLLGTGDKDWEEKLQALVGGNAQWLSINLTFSEELAHAMYAGSDFLLMPSKFEPCGLPQMIAERYGTLPIVHGVGGLKDSVIDGHTGFVFTDYSAASMQAKIAEALNICNTEQYWRMARAGMQTDFSWNASAKQYQKLYEKTAGFVKGDTVV